VGAEPLGHTYHYCDTCDWITCAGAVVTNDRTAHDNAPIGRRGVLTDSRRLQGGLVVRTLSSSPHRSAILMTPNPAIDYQTPGINLQRTWMV
jgi:hypothetical protein